MKALLSARVVGLAVAIALVLAACDGPVAILLDPQPTSRCYLDSRSGVVEYDSKVGTTVAGIPLMWPQGYTARRVGSTVEVLDARGQVRATTGETGYFSGAWYHLNPPLRGLDTVWLTC